MFVVLCQRFMRLTWLAAEERTTTKEHVVTSILSGHSLIPFVRGNRQMLVRHVDLRDVLGEHEKLGLRLTSPDLAYIPIDHATAGTPQPYRWMDYLFYCSYTDILPLRLQVLLLSVVRPKGCL